MNKFKVSHEVPFSLLEWSREFNDYDYCLPHLLDESEEYRNFFYTSKKMGRYIVMDNSLHELGKPYDESRLSFWLHELEPNEFIVPDYWMDSTRTLVTAKEWISKKYPKNTTPVAVVQGKLESDAYNCYHILRNIGYQKIAFSYGADWYAEGVKHPNPYMAKALGRIKFISKLYDIGIIKDNDRVHLLGCNVPQEFGWYSDMPFIESIDTSNPIMAALDGVEYQGNGLEIKPKANMNNFADIDIKNINCPLVSRNVRLFRLINNIPLTKEQIKESNDFKKINT